MFSRLCCVLVLACLGACSTQETPQQKEDKQALRREIERPLNRAHEAEATAKAQAEQNDKALEEAAGQ